MGIMYEWDHGATNQFNNAQGLDLNIQKVTNYWLRITEAMNSAPESLSQWICSSSGQVNDSTNQCIRRHVSSGLMHQCINAPNEIALDEWIDQFQQWIKTMCFSINAAVDQNQRNSATVLRKLRDHELVRVIGPNSLHSRINGLMNQSMNRLINQGTIFGLCFRLAGTEVGGMYNL